VEGEVERQKREEAREEVEEVEEEGVEKGRVAEKARRRKCLVQRRVMRM
jgi:hypothetical protein